MRGKVQQSKNAIKRQGAGLLKTLALILLVSYAVPAHAQTSSPPAGEQVPSAPGWASAPGDQADSQAPQSPADSPPLELRGIAQPQTQTPSPKDPKDPQDPNNPNNPKNLKNPKAPQDPQAQPKMQPPEQPPTSPPPLHGVGALDFSVEDKLLPLSAGSSKTSDATKIALSTQLQAIKVSLTKDQKSLKNYIAVDCTITNGTQIPIVIDGDRANLVNDKSTKPTVSLNKIDAVDKPPTGLKGLAHNTKSIAIAAATIGGYQTAQGFRMERKPVLQRYGWDEERRIHEDERFGVRLVYPGDSTTGTFFLPPSSLNNTIFECPIKSFYDEKNQAILRSTVEIKSK